jgi:hypothetical protein
MYRSLSLAVSVVSEVFLTEIIDALNWIFGV